MNAIKEARYNLGIAYLNDAQYREAISELEAVIKLDADSIDAHCTLSRAYLELNDLENAEKSAVAALSLNSNYPNAISQIDAIKNAYFDKGITFLNDERFKEAVKFLRKVETLDPNYNDIHYHLGRSFIGLKEYENAISSLQSVLTSESVSDDIHFHLGSAYVEQRQFDKAIQHLEKAILSDPNLIEAQYNLARAYRETGNLEAATNAVSETLRLDPNFQPIHDLVETIKQTHYNRGITHLNSERYSDAVAAFQNVIALDSDFTTAYFNLGMSYLKMENYPRAIDVLRKTVSLDHTHTTAYHALALAYFGHHELENARNAAKDALMVDPNFQPALSLLEAIDPGFSHKSLSPTVESKPTPPPEIDKVDQQDVEETVTVQEINNQSEPKEVDKETTKVDKELLRGSVFLNTKQYNQAAAAFKKVLKEDPKSVEALYGLGQVYYEISAFDDAETIVNEVLKLNPKHHPSQELLQAIKYVRNYERKKKKWKKVFIYTSIILIILFSLFVAIQFGFFGGGSQNKPEKTIVKQPVKPKQPSPQLSIIPSIVEPSGNGFIDAGETVQLKLIINNSGGIAENVRVVITPKTIDGLYFKFLTDTVDVKNRTRVSVLEIRADKKVKGFKKRLNIKLLDNSGRQLDTRNIDLKTIPKVPDPDPVR